MSHLCFKRRPPLSASGRLWQDGRPAGKNNREQMLPAGGRWAYLTVTVIDLQIPAPQTRYE